MGDVTQSSCPCRKCLQASPPDCDSLDIWPSAYLADCLVLSFLWTFSRDIFVLNGRDAPTAVSPSASMMDQPVQNARRHQTGHQYCPAAPRWVNGVLRHLTWKELVAVHCLGNRCHKDAQERQQPPAPPASMVVVVVPSPSVQSMQSAVSAPHKQAATQTFISEDDII
ncbi:conserved hypothetical protein [Histoplasma capsulatum var. duboisii H88]|uniref:Uncharacterized protein n=1 Tax=Ajellomyces capsulatus (strain H88) TaxID=544711 RepID=F0UA00_AJEC8|nr:conserved hypothetical protein [Histoplasma capsulatum var. duboisii H88]